MVRVLLWVVWALCAALVACGPERRIRTDAGLDAEVVDAMTPPEDASGFDAGETDASEPPVDGGSDAGTPGLDAGPTPGTGQYLDRCTGDGDCAGGRCVDDVGGSRFCSRACAAHTGCAHEHVCSDAGACIPDDTGAVCAVSTPATCRLGLCLGPAGGSGQCTRPCDTATQCPAGWACTDVGAAFRVCVDIEKPCTAAGSECGSNLCIPGVGCTATCRTAADCPARRFPGLPPYTCMAAFGSSVPICAPPVAPEGDIFGDDAMGAACNAAGNECRSGLCADLGAVGFDRCIQTCGPEGGCAVGWGCKPEEVTGGGIHTFCVPAGTGALGAACGRASQCASGLCDSAGYCTRLCADGLCPTGWSCTPVPGTTIGVCRR
ncbi:MAG: hypothetical protein KF901_20920 [Myxococcales bacterium]|nr:hypothetical protein [Myxococcales bacterium]